MDKLTAIKIKYQDDTYSDEIPLGVLAENVEWDITHNLIDILGHVSIDTKGNIQAQIDSKLDTSQLSQYVDEQLASVATDWLDDHLTPVGEKTSILIDDTLSVEGSGADAKAAGDRITNLENALNGTISLARENVEHPINWFDKSKTQNSGYYWQTDGQLKTTTDTTIFTTYPIFVAPGTYKFRAIYSTLGVNTAAVAIVDSSGTKIEMNNGTVSQDHNYVTVTIAKPCYISFNSRNAIIETQMFCLESQYPATGYVSGVVSNTTTMDNEITEKAYIDKTFVQSVNLFDKDDPGVTSGQYWAATGVLSTGQSASLYTSHSILVSPGTYKFTASGDFGNNKGTVAIVDNNGNLKYNLVATVTSNVAEFTINEYCAVQFNLSNSTINTAMFCKSSDWGSTYVPYSRTVNTNNLDLTEYVDYTDTAFSEKAASANLLDKSTATPDVYMQLTGENAGTLVTYTGHDAYTAYVPINGAGTYVALVATTIYGTSSKYIILLDKNKAYSARVEGTVSNKINTFEVTASHISSGAVYIGLTYVDPLAMIIKSSTYPSVYIPYYSGWIMPDLITEENPLYGKKIIVDGDSICAPNTDRANKGSYVGRIAEKNHMIYQNYGVSGGTITTELYEGTTARHWISANVDTMYAQNPDADYIIFEGGTNDADLIGGILNGETQEKFGTWTSTDFTGNYDDETFCGAVETMFFKAVSHWPTKKIGFIVAMKMANSSLTFYAFRNRKAYFDTLMDICKKWGISYINLWEQCPMNPYLASCYDNSMTADENIATGKLYLDGQHPTPTGYDVISPVIESWLRML